jgi:deoxyribonuclease-4
MQVSSSDILIGAHTSTAGGLHQALIEGQLIGASTVQFFTSNQKQWKGRPLTKEILTLWQETLSVTGLTHLMSHDSYLINLGCPNPENLLKSRQAFHEEVQRCLQLGMSYLNFHPGAALTTDKEECLNCIIDSLLLVKPLLEEGSLRLLIECTAGQGSTVGYCLDDLAYLVNRLKNQLPIGICLDTCHLFVAGYDIRTTIAWDALLREFDQIIGLQHLYAFHLNDSLRELGSRVDRHQPLGEGTIGWECFKFLMQDARTRHLPKYLETPGGPALWQKEIKQLKEFAKQTNECGV